MNLLDEYGQSRIIEEASRSQQLQAEAMIETQRELQRPSTIYKPSISVDGNQWCMLYGENLQDGVAGFGDTPMLAALDFDKNWLHGRAGK